jgi:condensin complex subunit 1
MAEQAINTIYLLGEQPDALCGDIIKSLTRAVFSGDNTTPAKAPRADSFVAGSAPSTPARDRSAASEEPTPGSDVAQAFHLSQLVFLVGHVAFKHIVYLELVEREIKRRKEVLAKGLSKCSLVNFP